MERYEQFPEEEGVVILQEGFALQISTDLEFLERECVPAFIAHKCT